MAPRLSAVAAAAAILLAACGAHAAPRTDAGASSTSTAPTTVDGEPPTSRPTANNGTPSRTPTTRSARSGGPNGAGSAPSASGDKIAAAAQDAPGQFAGVLLAPGAARAIVLDVRVESGTTANPDVISAVAQLLRGQSGKTVAVHGPTALSDTAQTHDAAAVRRVADTQGERNQPDTAVVHLLYFKGSFAQDGVLGVTVRADTIAVFPDQIAGATSPLAGEARIERSVVTHEVGHVLGLVDLFLNDNRDDPAHPGHSTNRGSVMYWAVESDVVSQLFDGPPPVDFDANDLADLAEIHSGAGPQG
ncbi:MAG: hypothetical protein QOJ00_2430 [Actinomycetota bacterium]|jgi:hypothetical protein